MTFRVDIYKEENGWYGECQDLDEPFRAETRRKLEDMIREALKEALGPGPHIKLRVTDRSADT